MMLESMGLSGRMKHIHRNSQVGGIVQKYRFCSVMFLNVSRGLEMSVRVIVVKITIIFFRLFMFEDRPQFLSA